MLGNAVCITRPTLQTGAEGADVAALQNQINRQFGKDMQLQVDGDFGIETEAAVKIIQYRYFLAQDGIAGVQTWQVLCTSKLIETPLLRRGDSSALVARVQQVLKGSRWYRSDVDGVFGKWTETAVIAFQRGQNLIESGKTDLDTWVALHELATRQTASVVLT